MKTLFSLLLLSGVALAGEPTSVTIIAPQNMDAELVLDYVATENATQRGCYDRVWDGKKLKFKKIPKVIRTTSVKESNGGFHIFSGSNLELKDKHKKCKFKLSATTLFVKVPGLKDPGGNDVEAAITLLENEDYSGEEQILECKLLSTLYCNSVVDDYYISPDGVAEITVKIKTALDLFDN